VFRERIKKTYKSLTPSFKRLAEFILNHELDVAFMTATELAKALGVDAATVVRFSQALGYRGYRELSKEIQQIVKADLIAKYAHFDKAKAGAERLQALLENERHNLEISVAQITDKTAEMVGMLAKAQRIWVIGEASGRHLAELFAAYLRMAGAKATAVDADPTEAARALTDLGERDLVVGLGIPGTGVNTAAALKFAQKQGAQTAAISVSAVSPPAQVTEHALICPATTPLNLASPASMMTVMMVLWQALMARSSKRLEERVATLQKTYATLLSESAKQGQKVDTKRIWREF